MKTSTLILIFMLGMGLLSSMAQTSPQRRMEQAVSIKILPSQLQQLQSVLAFSYQWLPKSNAPAVQVGEVLPIIQQLYPVLVADTVKKTVGKPVKK